jgi:photosystem II stability/assembly factor-like uncharacterized protein
MIWRAAAGGLCLLLLPLYAERWQIQYFFDQDKSSLEIVDLKFPSAQRGVAVGSIVEGNRSRPVALVTANGGTHWQIVPLSEEPVSLFFLNERLGWMVTGKGLWRTEEAGKTWRKQSRFPVQILRVYFADEQRGWAAGARKTLLETKDGGTTWRPVAAASEPEAKPEYTEYGVIAFANQKTGIVAGWNVPPSREREEAPKWAEPKRFGLRREVPHLGVTLETRDGGGSWRAFTVSMFGRITQLAFGSGANGLSLVEFGDSFEYPSEVFRVNLTDGKSERVFRDRSRAVTDVCIAPGGTAFLAAIEIAGQLRGVVPGKVKFLRSSDFVHWTEMDVDYKAFALRVRLAAAPDGGLWAATDTGMILKLGSETKP